MPGSSKRALWALVTFVYSAPWLAAAPRDGEPELLRSDFQGSESCRECHPRHFLEWRGSAHAYALVNPIFLAMNRLAVEETQGEIGDECLRCHSPIGARSGEVSGAFQMTDPSVQEAISCEDCHRMEPSDDENALVANGNFKLTPGDIFFGGLHKPVKTSAHDSARSEYLASSESCGVCHDVVHKSRRVENAFLEWERSVHRKRGIECHDCHMLRFSGKAAENSPFRETLRRHNFPGVSIPLIPFPNKGYQMEEIQRFLRTAVRMAVFLPAGVEPGAVLPLTVSVKNSGTAHNLPSGSMRQMWLEVTVVDPEGGILFRSGHLDANGDLMDEHSALRPGGDPQLVTFSDTHLDAQGKEVPYWRATRFEENSLRSLEARNSSYRISLPAALEATSLRVRVRLLLRPFSPYALRSLGLAHLADKLPVWELNAFESDPLPVLEEAPRRTEYRVPRDFPSVEAAVRELRDGDRLVVAPGEYVLRRPLDFRGKRIAVISREGPEKTVLRLAENIPPERRGSVVVFRGGEGPETRLEGFTITGGGGTLMDGLRRGGGIHIYRSSPTIAGNRIVDNSAPDGVGGGVCCEEGAPIIADNAIFSCTADQGGGLAYRGEHPLVLRQNSIQGNVARRGAGLYIEKGSRVRIERGVFAGNHAGDVGGGIYAADGARLEVDHSTFVHNRARRAAGAIYADPLRVSNSVLWSNRPINAGADFFYCLLDRVTPGSPTSRSGFPLFVDPGGSWVLAAGEEARPSDARSTGAPSSRWVAGDYRLLPGSPAIDSGDPNAPADPDDTRSDIGAFFFEKPLKGFIRGDIDSSGRVGWADLVALLFHLAEGEELPCMDAADADDGGRVDAADALLLAVHLLTGLPQPAAPFPACGPDPTFGEGLACRAEAPPCRREAGSRVAQSDSELKSE